jgi:sugar lactone lactonase YvrE
MTESGGGSVSGSGLYTAPATISGASATFHVVATSQADSSKSATAMVTVVVPVAVSISPESVALSPGGTQQFSATVTNAGNSAVIWGVTESGGGTVSGAGLYTAPASISGGSAAFHVVATSVADPSKGATATVGINAMPVISSFSATPATIAPGQSSTLAWTVANATSLSINQGVGTVTGTGTAVSPLVSTIYTLTASNASGAVNQSATVTVQSTGHNLSFLAGNLGGYGNLDGPGSAARFGDPYGVACDALGNVFVADSGNHTLRKIAPDGTVSTLAGASGLYGTADGTGSSARFRGPHNLILDPAGNLYIADRSNHTVRKMTPGGVVTTLAGGPGQSGAVDGNGTAARFKYPGALAMDASGNLFVSDWGNQAVRKITPAGDVSTVAGTLGQSGFVDGTGSAARFNQPDCLAMDGSGNLFVADNHNNRIRMITPGGVVTTFAGNGQWALLDGLGTSAQIGNPVGLAFDPSGNLYVSQDNDVIRKVTAAGQVSTVAGAYQVEGATDGQGSAASFYYPAGLAWDAANNRLLVADSYNHSIRTVSPSGLVGTLAGSPSLIGTADGQGAAARFYFAYGVAVDSARSIFVADIFNSTIRKVTLDGTVTTFAGTPKQAGGTDGTGAAARFYYPYGLAIDKTDNLFLCESANGNRIRKITPAGVVTTLAGSSTSGSVDGTGSAARFSSPSGIAVDASGTAFVSDTLNHTIRMVTPAGVVTTVAGTAGQSGSTDGVASVARFYLPSGIAVDSAGNLYITERANHILRKIAPDGTVSTLAGSAGMAGSADGMGSAARFNSPECLTLDPVSGNLLVGDNGNATLRVVTPAGAVSTLAGQAGKQGVLLGALPGVITGAIGIAPLGDGRFVFTTGGGLIVLNP